MTILDSVPKPSHRDKILTEGLKVVHQHGFANASVRDITKAAGVPNGSFTNHFPSKEMFGLAVVNLYNENLSEVINRTLRNDSLPPLQRLDQYIETIKNRLNQQSMKNGCLFSNFVSEASDHSEIIRKRLVEVWEGMEEAFAYCYRAAVQTGDLPPDFDCDLFADFSVNSLQGSLIAAKAQRSPEPVNQFKKILFSVVLR